MKLNPLLLLTIAAVFAADNLCAQAKGRPDPQFVRPDQINPADGAKVLEAFRSVRTDGDYSFAFELVNRPKNGEAHTLCGRMWGTWDENGPLTRTDIALEGGHTLHLIYHGGLNGGVVRSQDDALAIPVTGDARFQPIVEGLTFTPFDLQMSFMHWTDYVYEGTKKFIGRPAHYFILYPPKDFQSPDVAAVRVAVDADFQVMLMAEELDKDGKPLKAFRINDFAKVDKQWIVKEIDLVDERTKDRTRFKVTDAKVGLALAPEVFATDARGCIVPVPAAQNSSEQPAQSH